LSWHSSGEYNFLVFQHSIPVILCEGDHLTSMDNN
jgi:hypothetical protein